MTPSACVVGDDGLARCPWGAESEIYRGYHDHEWGMPVRGDSAIFERLSLEAFQSGLSWITILRKRDSFRRAFMDFDIDAVADFVDADVDRLLSDPGIVRNRAKVEATVANARLLRQWRESCGDGVLDSCVWSYAREQATPRTMAEVPASSDESRGLARELKARGWRFLGPTTAYAALQALGVVNDHLRDCHARARQGPARPSAGP